MKTVLSLIAFGALAHALLADPSAEQWGEKVLGPTLSGAEFSEKERESLEKKYLVPELYRLLLRDRRESAKANEPLRINFDWVSGAQEVPNSFRFLKASRSGEQTLLPAVLVFGNEKIRLTYVLIDGPNGFLIENIRYPEDDLLTILQQDPP